MVPVGVQAAAAADDEEEFLEALDELPEDARSALGKWIHLYDLFCMV